MTSSLISSLRGQNLKLASAMRTISWLRRIAPELEGKVQEKGHGGVGGGKEGSLGALFLVCRLANLLSMLAALEPLRELADQEALGNNNGNGNGGRGWMGQQTERYLKRYIEIFREQSFAIISVFRSIFPAESAIDVKILPSGVGGENTSDPLQPLPSSLGSFPLRLVDMLLEVLRVYLPNVRDRSARDSLLTQVLYCAGSLGRLGGDFSLVLAFLEEARDEGEGEEMDEEEEEEEEWVAVVKRHRVLAGRLESMVGAH